MRKSPRTSHGIEAVREPRPDHAKMRASASTIMMPAATTETHSAALPDRRKKRVMTAAEASGTSRRTVARVLKPSMGSVTQAVELFHHDRLPLPEKRHDNRQAHGDLRGRHGDDEEDEEIAVHDPVEP